MVFNNLLFNSKSYFKKYQEKQIFRDLLLIFVAYHPSIEEVENLKKSLSTLSSNIGYAVVSNSHIEGEPIEKLIDDSDYFLSNIDNPGYGAAINRLAKNIGYSPKYIGILNTDLYWENNTFERLVTWLSSNRNCVLAVPKIVDNLGNIQKLCKQNPTILALFSRRFIPNFLKPKFLKKYDNWYVMAKYNYNEIFESSYLSGCCMLVDTKTFLTVGGFDERYFLYLEDADLTRTLSAYGRCIHLPISKIFHRWGRGNYLKINLLIVNLISAFHYFTKWGFKFY